MLSIITPVHNEGKIIESFVNNAVNFLRKQKIKGEVVVIENGSKDKTLAILKKLQAKYPELVVEVMAVGNKGLALRRGLEIAKGEKLVTLDTDLWDAEFVEASIKNLENFDIVIGSKSMAGAKDRRTLPVRFVNWGYNFVMRLFFDFQGTETHAKLSFQKDKILPLVKQCKTSELVFDTELILRAERAKLSKVEIPTEIIEIRPRVLGKNFDQMVKTIKNCFVLLFAIGPKPNWTYLIFFSAIILGLFSRFYNYPNWFFMEVDEEHYNFMTRMITVNHHFPLIGGPISGTRLYMAPWFLYFNAIWFFISQNSALFAGMVTTLIALLTIIFIYLIGKSLSGTRAGAIGALLYSGSFLMALFDRHYWNITLAAFISAAAFFFLLRWLDTNKTKWLLIAALVISFGMSATFSVFAVFLFGLVVVTFYKKPFSFKNILVYLGIAAAMHLTLILFDMRHEFWSLRALLDFVLKPKFSAIPIIERVINTFVILGNSLGKVILINQPLDVSDEASICASGVMRFLPSLPSVALGVTSLLAYAMVILKKTQNKTKLTLPLVFLLINVVSLFLFRADPSERHFLPFYPLFFVIIGIVAVRVMSVSNVVKTSVWFLILAIVSINMYSLVNSWASYGGNDKAAAVKWIVANTNGGEFYLDSVGECHQWGYRYLFSQYGHEPAASYLDYDFSWMYSQSPTPDKAVVKATIVAANANIFDPVWLVEKRSQLVRGSIKRAKFGNVEVFLTRP